jgi:hypothetical protein
MLLHVPLSILHRAVISLHVPFLPVRDFRKEQMKIGENAPQKRLHAVVP